MDRIEIEIEMKLGFRKGFFLFFLRENEFLCEN